MKSWLKRGAIKIMIAALAVLVVGVGSLIADPIVKEAWLRNEAKQEFSRAHERIQANPDDMFTMLNACETGALMIIDCVQADNGIVITLYNGQSKQGVHGELLPYATVHIRINRQPQIVLETVKY